MVTALPRPGMSRTGFAPFPFQYFYSPLLLLHCRERCVWEFFSRKRQATREKSPLGRGGVGGAAEILVSCALAAIFCGPVGPTRSKSRREKGFGIKEKKMAKFKLDDTHFFARRGKLDYNSQCRDSSSDAMCIPVRSFLAIYGQFLKG